MQNDEKKIIRRKLLKYIIPSVTAMWVYTIYTMVDGMFVSNGVGPNALAAVNLCMPFINVAFGVGILFAVGTSTRASVYRGRGDMETANRIFTMSTLTVFVIAILITLTAYFNIDFFARLLGATDETYRYMVDYLSVLILFLPCYITAYNLEVLIKADGFPQKAILTASIAALLNILLDYLFVFMIPWGVKGAALATGTAQLSTFIVYVVHFNSSKSNFKFVSVKWKLKEIVRTVKLGIADCINEFSVAIITFLFNNVLLVVSGENGVVIYTIISYITQLTLNTMMGVNQGMQPLVSYYYGKSLKSHTAYILSVALKFSVAIGFVSFAICVGLPNLIIGAFVGSSHDTELIADGINALRMYAYCFLPLGIVMPVNGYFTALEEPVMALTVSLCRGCIFVAISLVIMSLIFGTTGVWLSMGVSEFAALTLVLILYKVKIKNNREVKQ